MEYTTLYQNDDGTTMVAFTYNGYTVNQAIDNGADGDEFASNVQAAAAVLKSELDINLTAQAYTPPLNVTTTIEG